MGVSTCILAPNSVADAYFSSRKWKAKLKEWSFEKHLSEGDMKIVVAKMDKRRRETGKDTVVFHNGVQVPAEKITNFKRRKVIRESDPASPGACGPPPPRTLRRLLMHL